MINTKIERPYFLKNLEGLYYIGGDPNIQICFRNYMDIESNEGRYRTLKEAKEISDKYGLVIFTLTVTERKYAVAPWGI